MVMWSFYALKGRVICTWTYFKSSVINLVNQVLSENRTQEGAREQETKQSKPLNCWLWIGTLLNWLSLQSVSSSGRCLCMTGRGHMWRDARKCPCTHDALKHFNVPPWPSRVLFLERKLWGRSQTMAAPTLLGMPSLQAPQSTVGYRGGGDPRVLV